MTPCHCTVMPIFGGLITTVETGSLTVISCLLPLHMLFSHLNWKCSTWYNIDARMQSSHSFNSINLFYSPLLNIGYDIYIQNIALILKPLDTFGKQYCQKAHTSCINKTTNLWKFRLNRSSESGENNGKTHPCFRMFLCHGMCLL